MKQAFGAPIWWTACAALLLGACAPTFVDEVARPVPQKQIATSIASEPTQPYRVVPTSPKPRDVVRPAPVPDPAAGFEPTTTAPLPPAQNRTPPPIAPIWQPPPPGYGAYRTSPAPLSIPNQPPSAWRY